ncbi:hypothetical protein MHU86_9160 [Fragilaria crotonensis]|nr:hypothetical protein MHU86_9160 [Fragilaria crotonensis]
MMTLYFQECNEDPPSIDPIHTAMLTIDNATISQEEPAEPVDKYLPEPQSLKAVLKLDDDIRSAWLHAIAWKSRISLIMAHSSLDKLHPKLTLSFLSNLFSKPNKQQLANLKLKARLVPEATWRNVF